MCSIYRTEQWLPYAPEPVFAFFANPENLPLLMPPWQDARIEKLTFAPPPRPGPSVSIHTIAAGDGTRITLSFRPFPRAPFRISWLAEISDFTWNYRFCDTQLRGPFAFWSHCHTLNPERRPGQSHTAIDGTLLLDEVHFEVPFGILGALAQRLFIDRQLRDTFDYRHARTLELLSTNRSS